MVSELPSGTVTFLFTDVEGSTRLWEEHPEAMQSALSRHDELVRGAIESYAGRVVKTTGDGFHAAFATARDALDAALVAQLALTDESWPGTGPIRVRMGIHTGEAQHRDGDYYGPALNRAARIMSVGNATEQLLRDALPDGCALWSLGVVRLRGMDRPEMLFQVTHPGLRLEFPALVSVDANAGNLPAQLTSFVGRVAELAELARMIDETRLSLNGVGGCGKTRLALELADRVADRYAGGAWLVELRPSRTATKCPRWWRPRSANVSSVGTS